MKFSPIRMRYTLTRRQRFIPHMWIWAPFLPAFAGLVLGVVVFAEVLSAWLLVLLVVPLWFARGFVVGIANVATVRRQRMDIVLKDKGIGFLAGGERWWLFLDGVLSVEQYCSDVWTIFHFNGTVINVPAEQLSDEALQHIRTAAGLVTTSPATESELPRAVSVSRSRRSSREG